MSKHTQAERPEPKKEHSDRSQRSQKSAEGEKEGKEQFLFVGGRRALLGGVITGVVALGAQLLVGLAYADVQAQQFLNTLIPASRSLAAGIVTASATILVLMLTILSITELGSRKLEGKFFRQVRNIARFTTFSLAGSILLLLFFNFPIEDTQNLPGSWYDVVYYILVLMIALITGIFIGTILMLYESIKDLIIFYHPERESNLVKEETAE